MRRNISLLSYLPIVVVFVISIVFFVFLYIAFEDNLNKELQKSQENVINFEKHYLKKSVKDFKLTFSLFKKSIYERTQNDLRILLRNFILSDSNITLNNDEMIFSKLPLKQAYSYNVADNKFIILNTNSQHYLVTMLNRADDIYLLGINKKIIDEFILEKIIEYLDKVNKGNISYIALSKNLKLNPKNGYFGYLYYMPPKLKNKEGMPLSIHSKDSKGNYFKKIYFKCIKKKKDCFVTYYFENPSSGKIEKKITYYSLLNEYNLSVLKGIYASQIKKELNTREQAIKRQFKEFFYLSISIYFVIFVIITALFLPFIFRTKEELIQTYHKLVTKLEYQYYFDDLTKLPNRNKLFEDIKKYKGLIVFDIDNFSTINEIYGFEFGNQILLKVKDEFKKYYHLYRVGSDEFAIGFCEDITENHLKNILEASFEYNNIDINFEIGGSNIQKRLFHTAEMAMNMAKKNRLKYLLYDEKIEKIQKEKFRKIQALHQALKYKNITPFYQCIVDRHGRVYKYEALMRVEVDGTAQAPNYFMDLIKEANIYSDFSKIMIEKVFKDLKRFKVPVSINLSYEDITNKELNKTLFHLLKTHGGEKVIFELLESESIKDFDRVKEFIKEVKKYKAKIAIDDFGSGYSNFVNVLDLNPDIIKIDSSIVKNLNNVKYKKIVELIVEFARNFNIKTVAEYVSDEEKFQILNSLGIDEYQGFYFCRPKPHVIC